MAFGPQQVMKDTPAWASWVFRIVFILTTVATFIVAAEPTIPDEIKVRLGVYMKGFDMLIYLLSKCFGVDLKKEEDVAEQS